MGAGRPDSRWAVTGGGYEEGHEVRKGEVDGGGGKWRIPDAR